MPDGVKYEIILSGIGIGSITLQEDKFNRNKTFNDTLTHLFQNLKSF